MAANLLIEGPTMRMELTVADGIMAYQPQVASLVTTIRTFRAGLALTRLRLIDQGGGVWLYRWDLADGRVWRQNLHPVNQAFFQTFNVTNEFLEAEYSQHRVVRSAIQDAMLGIALTRLDVTWT